MPGSAVVQTISVTGYLGMNYPVNTGRPFFFALSAARGHGLPVERNCDRQEVFDWRPLAFYADSVQHVAVPGTRGMGSCENCARRSLQYANAFEVYDHVTSKTEAT